MKFPGKSDISSPLLVADSNTTCYVNMLLWLNKGEVLHSASLNSRIVTINNNKTIPLQIYKIRGREGVPGFSKEIFKESYIKILI